MEALITHESSGTVREALRAQGVDAYSCDLLPADDGSPHHIRGDAVAMIRRHRPAFVGMHCACTYVCGSGIHWNARDPERAAKTEEAVRHVLECIGAANEVGAVWYLENPVGILSTRIRKPDQIVQPYEFGDGASKKTCLWLSGLPRLVLDPRQRCPGRWTQCNGVPVERWANQTDSGQNRLPPSADRWKIRSKTYPGIARQMAAQWAPLIRARISAAHKNKSCIPSAFPHTTQLLAT